MTLAFAVYPQCPRFPVSMQTADLQPSTTCQQQPPEFTFKWAVIPTTHAAQNSQILNRKADGIKKERAKNKETQDASHKQLKTQTLECVCLDREKADIKGACVNKTALTSCDGSFFAHSHSDSSGSNHYLPCWYKSTRLAKWHHHHETGMHKEAWHMRKIHQYVLRTHMQGRHYGQKEGKRSRGIFVFSSWTDQQYICEQEQWMGQLKCRYARRWKCVRDRWFWPQQIIFIE